MQHLKPKNSPSSENRAEQKSGIKEIICPATYAPLWQKAFALADNVRFTRTPDSEMMRRRAAIDPVYAKILAEAAAAKSAYQQQQRAEQEKAAATQSGEAAAAPEPAAENPAEIGAQAPAAAEPAPPQPNRDETDRAAENRGYARIEQMREEAEAAFSAGAKPPLCDTAVQNAAAQEAALLDVQEAEPAAADKAAEAAPAEAQAGDEPAESAGQAAPSAAETQTAGVAPHLFPWVMTEADRQSRDRQNYGGRETRRAALYPPAAAYSVAPSVPHSAPSGAGRLPPQADLREALPQMDITRLFKGMECRRPQMRWVLMPAVHAEAAAAGYNAAAAAAPQPPAPPQLLYPNGYSFLPSGSSAPQPVLQRHNAQANGAAAQRAAENLDALCSLAVEKTSAAAGNAPPALPLPQIQPLATAAAAAQTAQPARPSQAAPTVSAAPQPRQPNAKPHPLPHTEPQGATKYRYRLPPLDLLQEPVYHEENIISQESLERSAGLLESVLEDFGVKGEIIHVRPGPVVTLYEFEPAPGVKSSRIIGLSDDIARSMSAVAARVAVIPGRNVIGIELPNKKREMVYLREILQSYAYETNDYKLPLALGKNIGGEPIIAELAKMPHLLVAGTTGSGKSVAINTMILSLLYRMPPEKCRLIMVDPKMLELSIYDGIPHLLTPVVTDPKKAITALKWAVREMEDRYRKMAKLGVRNIDGFNARVKEALSRGETIMCSVQAGFDKETGELLYTDEAMDLTPLPYIVIIVDEMADLMMVAGKEIEGAIQRLAQMARAAGIHLIMATQRPSVDVITGTIKANFPTRISFQVTSKIDSRTILGEQGAETLLGQGDMLHMAGGGRLKRVHGPFVSDREVEKIVAHLKTQGTPEYLATVTESGEDEAQDGKGKADGDDSSAVAEIVAAASGNDDLDDLYVQAVKIVMRDKKCSTSYIQRRLGIGYNKAATLVEKMEEENLVGEANHVGKREILINN